MKQINPTFALTLFAIWLSINQLCSQNIASKASTVPLVFVASTPCSSGTRPLPGIPVAADCEFITWKLTLLRQVETLAPTTYKLKYVFGLSKPGTPGFVGGGTKVELEGKWTILNGNGLNADAIIYQLDLPTPQRHISFLKLNDNLLHLLDSDKRLMIGNASFSYTLNRMKDR